MIDTGLLHRDDELQGIIRHYDNRIALVCICTYMGERKLHAYCRKEYDRDRSE